MFLDVVVEEVASCDFPVHVAFPSGTVSVFKRTPVSSSSAAK